MKTITIASIVFLLLFGLCAMTVQSAANEVEMAAEADGLTTLITDAPEDGFHLAIRLARRGVTETQPDKEVLHALRGSYSRDADALTAASRVVAVHFQTIAAANDYWRDTGSQETSERSVGGQFRFSGAHGQSRMAQACALVVVGRLHL